MESWTKIGVTPARLALLRAPFPPSELEWKPGPMSRDKSKTMPLVYVTNRHVMERLDTVCGAANWQNRFRAGPDGGVVCGISIRVATDDNVPIGWVTKWDGAAASDVEAVKGGISGAQKRAAVQWGLGRDLYGWASTWVKIDRGRMAERPRVPTWYRELCDAYELEGTGEPAAELAEESPEVPAREDRVAREAVDAALGFDELPQLKALFAEHILGRELASGGLTPDEADRLRHLKLTAYDVVTEGTLNPRFFELFLRDASARNVHLGTDRALREAMQVYAESYRADEPKV